jgi:hypothetical protein
MSGGVSVLQWRLVASFTLHIRARHVEYSIKSRVYNSWTNFRRELPHTKTRKEVLISVCPHIGLTWLIALGERGGDQTRPWALGTLINERVKLERVGRLVCSNFYIVYIVYVRCDALKHVGVNKDLNVKCY